MAVVNLKEFLFVLIYLAGGRYGYIDKNLNHVPLFYLCEMRGDRMAVKRNLVFVFFTWQGGNTFLKLNLLKEKYKTLGVQGTKLQNDVGNIVLFLPRFCL